MESLIYEYSCSAQKRLFNFLTLARVFSDNNSALMDSRLRNNCNIRQWCELLWLSKPTYHSNIAQRYFLHIGGCAKKKSAMSGEKEPPDKHSPEENPFVHQWTTFEWEKITDNMRRAIQNTPRNATNFKKTSTPLDLESLQQNSKVNVDGSQDNTISTLRDGLYFNPNDLLEEITSSTDHPSQLVDALKVGLADILDASKLEEQDDSSDDENFSKSLDETFDECSKSDLEADSVSPINRVVGSSESDVGDDDVTDISTTESRESVVEIPTEAFKAKSPTPRNKDLTDNQEKEEKATPDEVKEDVSQTNTPIIANVNSTTDGEIKSDIDPVSFEPLETCKIIETLDKETINDDPSTAAEQDEKIRTSSHDNNNHEIPSVEDKVETPCERPEMTDKELSATETDVPAVKSSPEPVEQDDDTENWKKDITVEEISFVHDVDVINDSGLEVPSEDLAELGVPSEDLAELGVPSEDLAELGVPSEDLAELQSDQGIQDSNKTTYADILKKGLCPDVITPVKPLTFAQCCQKERRAVDDANNKSPKKTPNKDRKSRRPEYTTKKQRASPSCHGVRATPDKGTSTPPRPSAKPSVRKEHKRETSKSPSRKTSSCRKISFDQCDYWNNDDSPSESSTSISDDASAEELLREKIKREQIAKVLQEAKLTLAKLTSESLGSYEKVSCLKQVPSANNDAFELLQCQEINKSKHMKELANSLHELTQMGLGNAKEFAEIKDILISLHYLQSKDKYFIEKTEDKPTGEKTSSKASKRNKEKDTSVSAVFFIILSLFILFMFIFKRQWFIIICTITLILLCFFGQQKSTKNDKVNKKQIK